MDSSYPTMNLAFSNKQQTQPYLNMPQHCWLLQQPHDSGYVDGDDDLFAQAFKSYRTDLQTLNEWVMESQQTPTLSTPSSTSSPFEYADSLVLPSKQWQPYETNYSATYCLDGPAAYNLPQFQPKAASMVHNTEGLAQATPAQNMYSSSENCSQLPLLQASMVDDTASLVESDALARPRQREHHTAVEQRYRKNLNEQFNNLRLAVPDIQTSQPQRAGQPAKPSKCEVLAGAVDYIKRLEEELQRMKAIGGDDSESSRKRARTMG